MDHKAYVPKRRKLSDTKLEQSSCQLNISPSLLISSSSLSSTPWITKENKDSQIQIDSNNQDTSTNLVQNKLTLDSFDREICNEESSNEIIIRPSSRPNSLKNLKPLSSYISLPETSTDLLPTCILKKFPNSHTKPITCLRWSNDKGRLLLTSSLDSKICVWDPWESLVNSSKKSMDPLLTLSSHTKGVKQVCWRSEINQILSCSLDQTVSLTDVETGSIIQKYKERNYVTSICLNPKDDRLFLSGVSKTGIFCFDIRTKTLVRKYETLFGDNISSIEFINSTTQSNNNNNGSEFISSSDITRRNSLDKSILVWHFDSGIILSNQVYQEAYTCPCIRSHPSSNHFVAQSNGDYIAIFSSLSPYKMNKYKRFEGHRVSGYGINCNFSPTGRTLVTGSSDGSLCFYDWYSTKLIKRFTSIQINECPSTDVVYHPTIPGLVVCSGWNGQLSFLSRGPLENYQYL